MMIDKDQELFLDYIKQLLYNTDEATLCRDELSDDVTQLADGIFRWSDQRWKDCFI